MVCEELALLPSLIPQPGQAIIEICRSSFGDFYHYSSTTINQKLHGPPKSTYYDQICQVMNWHDMAIWLRYNSIMQVSCTHMVWLKVLSHLFYMVNKTLAREIKVYKNCSMPGIPRVTRLSCLTFDNGMSNRYFKSKIILEKVRFNSDISLLTQCSAGKHYNNINYVFIFVFPDMGVQNWWKQMDKPV